MSCHYSALALASALMLVSIPAAAEDENSTIIVTAPLLGEQAEAQASRIPGGADVIAHQDYADRLPVSLRDVLAFSPGVYVQPRYGQEIRLSVRGSGLSRSFHMRGLTLLQDGVPINLADDNGDFQELEPIFFDHLAVYRGANGLRWGSTTLGGAINGVTPTGRSARGLYLRADAGSFDTWRGLAAYGGTDDVADYWIAASADASDGDRDHANRQSLRFHGNVGLELSAGVSTRFYASVNHIEQDLPGALTRAVALSAPRTGNFTGDQARDIHSLRVQNRTTVDLGAGTLEAGLFLNAKQLFHPIFQVIDQKSLDRGAYARIDWRGDALELLLGGEIRVGDNASRRYVNVDGRRGAPTFVADLEARTASLYGELRYRPVPPVTLIAGGVFADGWRAQHERFNVMMGGARDVRARAAFSAFSPRIGLLLEPREGVQIFANYSRSVEFPGFSELAQISQFVPVCAQRAWTAEVGTRGVIGILQWDFAAYRADLKGEMLQYTVSADIPAATFNAGRTRHQGVEAALTITPAPWLRLRSSYQYSDFRFRHDIEHGGNRLPVVPRHMLRAEARIGGDALHVSPHVEWVPQGAWADYANSARAPGYALLGATAGMQVTDGLDLFLDARNLTGRKAIGDISATIRATDAAAIYYPVERRALFGGVRARF